MRAYEMKMVFAASMSVPELNEIADMLGEPHLQAEVLDVVITETAPDVPDEETLAAMAQAIKEEFNADGTFCCEEVRFDRYDKLVPVDVELPEEISAAEGAQMAAS